jgi:CheY-like chemotaxis protein
MMMANMVSNRKDQDETKSKTETTDFSGPASVSLKEVQRLKIQAEGRAEDQKEIFSSGNSISSFGTESLRTKSGENKEETSRSSRRKFKILVVDDNENIRDMLQDFLSFEGHQPVLAKEGEEALKLFLQQDFDMVITDLGMPGMSGWELSKQIKQREPEMPVVIITGWGAQLSGEAMKESKADSIISKPFNLDQIQEVLEKIGAKLLRKES